MQEPEKPLMLHLTDLVVSGLHENDILAVGRTLAAESSLSPVQQRTERLAGWILERTHHLPPDALAGPRGFTKVGLANYPADKPDMNNWIYMYRTPLEARAAGPAIGWNQGRFDTPCRYG